MHVSLATEAAPGRRNEDFVAATSDAAVLLDGAGASPGSASGCSHGVPWYVRSLGAVLLAELPQTQTSLTEILAHGIKHVTSLHDFTCDLSHPASPSAAVVMMRRTNTAVEFLSLAESVIVLDVSVPEPMVIRDERVDLVAVRYRAGMESVPRGTSAHIQAVREYAKVMRDHRDREFWVASMNPLAAEQSLTGSVPADQTRSVALLSDGASRLVDRFGLITWRQLLALLSRHGPLEVIRQVRVAEDADPNGHRRPRGLPYDDASIIYWEPGGPRHPS